MAKRRNLKKEKAARNRAYARQFRKKSPSYSNRNKRFRSNFNPDEKEDEKQLDSTNKEQVTLP